MAASASFETQLKFYKQELDIVHSVLSKIHSEMDMDALIEEIIAVISTRIPFDECNIALIEDDEYLLIHNLRHSHFDHMPDDVRNYMRHNFFGQRFHYKTSPVWVCKVAREGMEIFFPESDTKGMTENEKIYFKTTGTSAVLILPLRINDKILGSIMFANYGEKLLLSEEELNFFRRSVFMISRVIESHGIFQLIRRQNEELEFDLKLASRIQNNFLPKAEPGFKNVHIESRYIPMKLIGGDYFDFITLPGVSGFGVFISDVSGHGVPSAFITSMIKMVIQSEPLLKLARKPARLLMELNKAIVDHTAGHFISAQYCFFDLEKKVLRLARAGHPPLIVVDRNTGEQKEILPRGKLLGIFEETDFEELTVPLKSGQRFLFYTDGLIEAVDSQGREFGGELEKFLDQEYALNLKPFVGTIVEKLLAHSLFGKREYLEDDVALVVLDIDAL